MWQSFMSLTFFSVQIICIQLHSNPAIMMNGMPCWVFSHPFGMTSINPDQSPGHPEVCAPWCCREFFHDRANDGEWPELSGPRGAAKKCPRTKAGFGGQIFGVEPFGGGIISHPTGMSPYPNQREVGKIIDSNVSNSRKYVILPRSPYIERGCKHQNHEFFLLGRCLVFFSTVLLGREKT